MGGIVILDSCGYHFIRVHENLVQHPSNNISITRASIYDMTGMDILQFYLGGRGHRTVNYTGTQGLTLVQGFQLII